MKKFEFSKSIVFSGSLFYNANKDAEFLRDSQNIETILSKGYELRNILKEVEPGKHVEMVGMWLRKDISPLVVKKTGKDVTVGNYEFTANRLSGFVAAYAFDNRSEFPVMKSSEALSLGLAWDNEDETKCRLFLSAVSGTEHFYDQFHYWPLICAIRKLDKKTIPVELVLKIAKIKNKDGVQMGKEMMAKYIEAAKIWSYFPSSSNCDLSGTIRKLPVELKKVLLSTV